MERLLSSQAPSMIMEGIGVPPLFDLHFLTYKIKSMKRMFFFALPVFAISFLPFQAKAQSVPNKENQVTSLHSIKTEKMLNQKNESKSFTEFQEVVKALQPYIKSARTGDGQLSRTAFYDHAHILGSIDGEVSNVDADQFGKAVSAGGASEDIQHQIAWIDISGPAAAAKVEFINWSGLRFTDFFVLYKENGEWKISGKVYDSHSRN